MINIGIVGYGYWGPNLVRNFAETPGANVAAVSDLDTAKLAVVQRRFPAVKTTTDFRELLNDPAIDAIAIATPVNTHFELALAALRAGKHVWVEKPMTETSEQARQLVDEAQKRKLQGLQGLASLFGVDTGLLAHGLGIPADLLRSRAAASGGGVGNSLIGALGQLGSAALNTFGG